MVEHWYPSAIDTLLVDGGYTITLTTDTSCHLWLYWTDKEPWVHRRTTNDRGLLMPWHSYWCFVDWHKIEQNEPGDTTTHTFDWPGWVYCQTKWFTFHGDVAGVESPSSGPILHLHYEGPPPPPPFSIIRLFTFRNYVTGLPVALQTRTVDNDGIITDPLIDSVQIEPNATWPKLLHISGNVYLNLYCFQGTGALMARTYTITPAGDIDPVPIDTQTLDATLGRMETVRHIAGNVYACVYQGVSNYGYVVTFEVNPDGSFGAIISSRLFWGAYFEIPSLIHIAGTIYAIVFLGTGNDGFLRTYEIQDNGTITGPKDYWEYDTSQSIGQDIIHVAGTVYAIIYCGPEFYFNLKTLNIADDGTITKSWIDTRVKPWENLTNAYIHRGNGNYFLVGDSNGACTFHISDAGVIAADATDTVVTGRHPRRELAPGLFISLGNSIQTFSVGADGMISPILDTLLLTGWTITTPDMITLATG